MLLRSARQEVSEKASSKGSEQIGKQMQVEMNQGWLLARKGFQE